MLLIKNVHWLDPDSLTLAEGHLLLEEGPHGSLTFFPQNGPAPTSPAPTTVLNAKGKLATRAFACAHHHSYSALSRGMPPAPDSGGSFTRMLELVWWKLDRRLDHNIIEASALATAMQCAKNGVTFIIDHHSSPFAVSGSLGVIARAFEQVGLGHALCCELSDRDGTKASTQGLEETDHWLSSGHAGHVGLHASFTVGDDLLRQAVALARHHNTGIHIHVAESVEDQEHCLRTHGKRVIQRLADAGVLDLPHSILAHAIHINQEERDLVRQSPAWVVQNPESNLNNRVGLGRYADLPRVMLGTDGMHSDMLRAMQSVWYAAPGAGLGSKPEISPYTGLSHLPAGNSVMHGEHISPQSLCQRLRAVHTHTASLHAPGDGNNNIVLLDYDSPTPLNASNAAAHMIFGLSARHVHTVIAQGKLIVENRQCTQVDEEEALAFIRTQAARLWAKMDMPAPSAQEGPAA